MMRSAIVTMSLKHCRIPILILLLILINVLQRFDVTRASQQKPREEARTR